MNTLEISCTVDMSGLVRGIEESSKYSSRTVPEIVNTAAYWIAVNAKNMMVFVEQDRIDSELAVIESAVIGKRGKPLKNKKRYRGGITANAKGLAKEVPLAVLIVAARARPDSKYNRLTHRRYMLDRNPFAGVSRAEGQAAMKRLEDQMIKSRHRSPKFLLAGWIPAVRRMYQFAVTKFLKGGIKPSEGAKSYYGAELGSAQPALLTAGKLEAEASIENDVGLEGQNAASFNRALMTYGTGPLQLAVDTEGQRQMAYALRKFEEEHAEKVNRHWS